MAGDKSKSGQAALLQQRVEAVLRGEGQNTPNFSTEELSKLVGELRAHQIELETQNEALARSTAQFNAIFDAMAEAVVFVDTERRIRAMNPAALRLWGYTLDELERKTTACLYADMADYERQGEERYHVGAQPESQDYELWYRRKDASTFLGESISTHVRDSQGNILGFVGVNRDITEQRQVEEALRLSEERFRVVFEEAASSIVIVDADTGGFVEFNEQAHSNLGYTREEFQKLSIGDFDVMESAADVARHIQHVMGTGGDIFEARHRGKDGRIREMLVSARALRLPGRNLFIGIWTDITAPKQAEEELKRSESNLAQAQKLVHLGSWDWDIRRNRIHWSDEMYRIWGYEPLEFVPKYEEFLSTLHADDLASVERAVNDTLSKRAPYNIEYRIKTKNEQARIISAQGEAQFDDEGNPVCMFGTALDITERRQAEEELQASETNYREVFNAANDAFFIHDMATGKILDVNAAMCKMYGVTMEEACRMQVSDISSDEPGYTQLDAQKQIAKAGREGKNVFEWRARRKSGELFWVEVSLRRAEIGGQERVLAVVRDITERKRAEEALRTYQAQLSNAMEIAKLGYWEYDVAEDLFTFNDHFYSVFRTSAEDVGGYKMSPEQYARQFLHPDDAHVIPEEMKKALNTTDPDFCRILEHRIRFADGEVGHILVRYYVVKDEQGRTIKTYGANQDITDRKRAEEALQQAHDELERRVEDRTKELVTVNARLREEIAERQQSEERERQLQADLAHVGRLTTMGEMASGLAHELNQPLAAISLQSEVITRTARESGKEVSDDLLHSLEFIAKQAYRAGDLIRRMREFVKHTAPKRVVLSVAELVDEVLLLAQKDLQESGIALEKKVNDPRLEIRADKVQLQQVLLNLIRNAVEAMETTEIDQRRLRIETRTRDQLLEVAVRDVGCGIPADKVEHVDELFGTFYSTKKEGLGMGLAISRSIVESHGGRIWATPSPDRGTTFTFTVPIANEDRENETETPRVRHR